MRSNRLFITGSVTILAIFIYSCVADAPHVKETQLESSKTSMPPVQVSDSQKKSVKEIVQVMGAEEKTRDLSVNPVQQIDESGAKVKGISLYDNMIGVVIGIDRYMNLGLADQLRYAVHDAKGVEQVLKKHYPFKRIITLFNEDATRDRIMKVLQGDLSLTGPEDAVLIYFAGHGITRSTAQGDLGYLVPSDGSLKIHEAYKNISMQQIKADVCPLIPAKHVLIVVDACFGGLLLATRSGALEPLHETAYLREITREPVRQIITAGGKDEPVLDGGRGGHSVFTGRLITALEDVDDFITGRELGLKIQQQVYADAAARGHTQRPLMGEVYGTGDFVFIPNFEQKMRDKLQAAEAEVKSTKAKSEELSRIYEKLLEDEKALKQRLEKINTASQKRQLERQKAALEAKKKAHELEQARIENELRQKAERQREIERKLKEEKKIEGTIENLEHEISKSFQEIEAQKAVELARIERDKIEELTRVKELEDKIRLKRKSLEAAKLETLTISEAMEEIKNIRVQKEEVSRRYDQRIADALRNLQDKYENQRQRYTAEIEKLDKALKENEEKIEKLVQEYYSDKPKKDMFETELEYQNRLKKFTQNADKKAIETRARFENRLQSIKLKRNEYIAAVDGLTQQHKSEKKDIEAKFIMERDSELQLYDQQLDDIVSQTFSVPLHDIELLTYLPEKQLFPMLASLKVNNQNKDIYSHIEIISSDARMLWTNRSSIIGNAILKLKQYSDEIVIISLEIGDGVTERKYPAKLVNKGTEWGGRFIALKNGRIIDLATYLEWMVGPDKDTTWDEATRWVDSLTVAGGRWRMPTVKELETLYEKGRGIRNMVPLLKTTGWYIWSGEAQSSTSAWYFDASSGDRRWASRHASTNVRAFAVRSR